MDDAERQVLAQFCLDLPDLRAEVARLDETKHGQLARIERAAAEGRPISGLLKRYFDIDPAAAHRSLHRGLPGAGAGRAHEELFGCPHGHCAREERPVPAGPVPRCQVTNSVMKRIR
jgi:hypothetical protein